MKFSSSIAGTSGGIAFALLIGTHEIHGSHGETLYFPEKDQSSQGEIERLRGTSSGRNLGKKARGKKRDKSGAFTDDPIDVEAVIDGSAGWFPSIYGPDDQLGTLNEITPKKTIEAMMLITGEKGHGKRGKGTKKRKKVATAKSYNLGELMQPGVPAFDIDPPRLFDQKIIGPFELTEANELTFLSERLSTTFQIATQVDGLSHIAVGDLFYNGFEIGEMIDENPVGVNFLGQEHVDPFITRGILLDVLSVKILEGDEEALGEPVDGKPILAGGYRITLKDLRAAMRLGKISRIAAGDVVLIRTGWTHLFSATDEEKKSRYLSSEPGIYLREARWLAQFRPAIVASDTWGLEVLPSPDATQAFPVHQELLVHHGIRIGEAFRSEELADDGVYEFLFFYTPQRAKGATSSNTAPRAIGIPTR